MDAVATRRSRRATKPRSFATSSICSQPSLLLMLLPLLFASTQNGANSQVVEIVDLFVPSTSPTALNETRMPSVVPSMAPSVCTEVVEVNVTQDGSDNSTNGTDAYTTINVTRPCTQSPTEAPFSLSIGFRSSVYNGLITQLQRDMSLVRDDTDEVFPTQAFIDITIQYIETFYRTSPVVFNTVKITNVQIQIDRIETSSREITAQTNEGEATIANADSAETATVTITTYTIVWNLILTYFGDLTNLQSNGILSEEAFVNLPFANEEDRAVYLEMLTNSTEFDESFTGVSQALVGTTLMPSAMPSAMPTVERSVGVSTPDSIRWFCTALLASVGILML